MSHKNPEINMAWGEPYIVRQALIETLGPKFGLVTPLLSSMSYTPHLGYPQLIEQLKDLAERYSGHRPKHLFVTCGASGAIQAALYALQSDNKKYVITNRRYFPLYPSIISRTGMIHTRWGQLIAERSQKIVLDDSPSNPDGIISIFVDVDVWDAAYATKTYSYERCTPKTYKVMCGSLSKILGLPGLRLGWASTDDQELADSLSGYIVTTYVGLSGTSQYIAESVLHSLDFDSFEERSAGYLDDNRQEVQKILTKFGQPDVPSRGMFATLELGKAERKALERAHIKWQPGSTWGEDDNWARLSLGQTREEVKKAVKAVLK